MIQAPKPCIKCGKLGIEKSIEILPDQAMLIQVMHNDGSEPCEFQEYASLSTFVRSRTKSKDPKIMDCPECGDKGRIDWYRRKKTKQFHKWDYLIVHEQIEGFWGKAKIKRSRRCYIKTEAQRSQVLKQLGENRL